MEYEKCLVEVDEILMHLREEELIKIPYEIRKSIKEQKDKQYNWDYDESKELNEQNINRRTIAILSYLNMEYLVNTNQKFLLEELHKIKEKNREKENLKKYNPDNIFKENIDLKDKDEVALIEVKEKWYKRLFLFIKKTLKK